MSAIFNNKITTFINLRTYIILFCSYRRKRIIYIKFCNLLRKLSYYCHKIF